MYWETIKINDVEKYIGRENSIIVDLRSKVEYENGHIWGAVNIPYIELDQLKFLLKKYAIVYLYCDRGNTSMLAAKCLSEEGYEAVNLYGGIRVYRGKLVK